MLTKIIIQNVGLLKAFATPDSPKLAPLTVFYARNGRGKSTLTAVLRAARDGCSSTVMGRRSLGNNRAAPVVTLVSDTGSLRFADEKWSAKGAPIEVFDTTFITDNVFAGELIDLAQDRGLFSVIIGAEGVRLANHLERFNVIAKAAAAKLKEAETALADDVPSDMTREAFFALPAGGDYAKRLDEAERSLKAVQQAEKIAALKSLEALSMPELPAETPAVLTSTVAEIDSSARQRLLDHFKGFKFDKKGEAWISYGVEHIHDDACPFCGRDEVDAAGMVTLYGQIFGETYKAHLATITTAATAVEDALGEDARTALANKITTNAEAARKWAEYVQLERELPDMAEFAPFVTEAHKAAKALFDKKRSSPLDCIEAAAELAAIAASLASARELLDDYNDVVAAINAATAKASAATPVTEDAAKRARDNVKKRMERHDPGVEKRVAAYLAAKARDKRARDIRGQVQTRLKDANKAAAEHYYERVNHYLGRFGANFTISKITNSMPGNAGQVDYGLLIKGETVARGRGRQAEPIPTFRNTLSSGDKTTLAFAFFLAKLEHDPALATKTVVIDDPMGSHDSNRRQETIDTIKAFIALCRQVIVLSHDEFFLRDVSERCGGVDCAAYQIEFNDGEEWSAAKAVDLDALCASRHAKLLDALTAFVDHRRGDPDEVVLKVRKVLETHYRRSFSAYFPRKRNLGQIVRDIAAAGPSHPCHGDYVRLESLNAATCDEHHGEDARFTVKTGVDPDALRVKVRDALELIGARRPGTSPRSLAAGATPSATPAPGSASLAPAGVS